MKNLKTKYPYLVEKDEFLKVYPNIESLETLILEATKEYRNQAVQQYEEQVKLGKTQKRTLGHSCILLFLNPGDSKTSPEITAVPLELNATLFSSSKGKKTTGSTEEVLSYIATLFNKVNDVMNGFDMTHIIAETLSKNELISSYKFLGCIVAIEASSMKLDINLLKGQDINLENIKEIVKSLGLTPDKSLMFHSSTLFYNSVIQYKINSEDDKVIVDEEPFEVYTKNASESEDKRPSSSGETAMEVFGNVFEKSYEFLEKTDDILSYINKSVIFSID